MDEDETKVEAEEVVATPEVVAEETAVPVEEVAPEVTPEAAA